MGRARGLYGEEQKYIKGFGEEPEQKRPLVRPNGRWTNINMGLKEL
jgi:hypothetical protein